MNWAKLTALPKVSAQARPEEISSRRDAEEFSHFVSSLPKARSRFAWLDDFLSLYLCVSAPLREIILMAT